MRSGWLLAVILIFLNSPELFSQSRLWGNIGYSQCTMGENPVFFKSIDADKLMFKYRSPLIELNLENYINYNTAIVVGIGYWQNGYSTKGYHLHVDDYDNKLIIMNNGPSTQIDFSSWTNHLIKFPIAIEFAPQGKQLEAALGVELNLILSSTLSDSKDYFGTIYETNITPYFKRALFNTYFSISYKWKTISATGKVFAGITNYSDANTNRAVINSEILNQAQIASFYRSISSSRVFTNGFQLSIGFRLY